MYYMPAGISWADRNHEIRGDYEKIAFLAYGEAPVKFTNAKISEEERNSILRQVEEIYAQGEIEISTAGQTVTMRKPK
jgi:hypothetical protein